MMFYTIIIGLIYVTHMPQALGLQWKPLRNKHYWLTTMSNTGGFSESLIYILITGTDNTRRRDKGAYSIKPTFSRTVNESNSAALWKTCIPGHSAKGEGKI
jgi:hypothetical protein